jgi:hypothetical protein
MKNLIYLLPIALLMSCSTASKKEQKKSDDDQRTSFKETPLDNVYSTIRPDLETFNISNNKSTEIEAALGTKILIPQGCFVDNEGRTVTGEIQMEIIEAFSLSDFITSGLITLSEDKLLLSNGMLFIDAKSNGTSLKIKEGSELTVSMPTITNNNGYQMFTGDGRNWSVDSNMIQNDYLIPLPLDLLYLYGNKNLYHCSGGKDNKYAYYDTSIISYTNSKFENTIIATMEFRERFYPLLAMMHNMSLFTLEGYLLDKVDCYGCKYNYDIFKIYYDNPNKSLRFLDSVAKKTYDKYFLDNKKRIASFIDKVNLHKQNYYSNWTDTNYYYDLRHQTIEEMFILSEGFFPAKDSRELKLVNDYGVNLNSSDAYEQLLALNVPIDEINEVLQYNFKRQSIITQLENEKRVIDDKETLSKTYETTVFSTKKLGWINCDKFYDDPNAGIAEIIVTNKSNQKLNFIDYSLIIPKMNVRLSSFKGEDQLYSFSKKQGPYTKLPIGESAVVVGVSIQNDSVFFASQKIIIEDGIKLDVNLKYIQIEDLGDSLKLALKQTNQYQAF